MLLHTVKQQNKMGVEENFYTVDVLTVCCTYLPKNYKCSFKFAQISVKILLASFCEHSITQYKKNGYVFCGQNRYHTILSPLASVK